MTAVIQTRGGRMLDLAHPDPYLININDIAHALSHLCRFGGHTRVFYSVANHSVLVASIVPAEDALAGLLHDATEAYCQDLVAPLKALVPAYKDIEAGLWEAIAWKYRVADTLPQSVVDADCILCATEIRDLLNGDVSWMVPKTTPLPQRLQPLSVAASRAAFLKEFFRIKGERNAKK